VPKGKEPIITQKYKRALYKCKNHKSTEKDGLSAELVKLGGEAMETAFIKTFNRVLETGKLPRHMQISLLIPIFKKGALDACENYSPIAITEFIHKLFSYIIYNRLLPQSEPFLSNDLTEARETPSLPFYASQRNAGVRWKRSMSPFLTAATALGLTVQACHQFCYYMSDLIQSRLMITICTRKLAAGWKFTDRDDCG